MGSCLSKKDNIKNVNDKQNKTASINKHDVKIDTDKLGCAEEPSVIVPDDYDWSK